MNWFEEWRVTCNRANAAEAEVKRLTARVAELVGGMAAQDDRAAAACSRVGIPPHGCDTFDALADEVLALRAQLAGNATTQRPIPTTPITIGPPMPIPPDDCASVTERQLRHRVAELKAEARWIPVGEALPDECVDVLVCADGQVRTAIRADDIDGVTNWYANDWGIYGVTHWRPMPKLPEAA